MQHSVAVVEPRQYEAARQGKCQFRRQQMADVSDGISVEVKRPIATDVAWPGLWLKSGNSSKTAYSRNAEFEVSFGTLMSGENLREDPIYFYCRTSSGFNAALCGQTGRCLGP